MKRTILALAIVGGAGGLANAAGPHRAFPRGNDVRTLTGDTCRPIAERLVEARNLLKALPASTSLDTIPSVVPSIWFRTNGAGIDIPSHLRAEYPTDVAIILEYRYRNLKVTDTSISVTVSFKGVWEALVIPWGDVLVVSDRKSGRDIDLRGCP